MMCLGIYYEQNIKIQVVCMNSLDLGVDLSTSLFVKGLVTLGILLPLNHFCNHEMRALYCGYKDGYIKRRLNTF